MIFFCVWLRVYSREVLRELFQLPKNVYYNRSFSNYRSFSCRLSLDDWAFGFDLFPHSVQHNEPKPKTPIIPSLPSPPCGWALGFDLFQRTFQPTRAKAQNSSHAPPCRRPAPSFGRRQPAAGLRPPHNPTGKYMRKRLNHFSTPV